VPRRGTNQNLYYRWSKDFLGAGKKALACDTAREATSDEVKGLRAECRQIKEMLAKLMMENCLLKKGAGGGGVRYMRYAAAEWKKLPAAVTEAALQLAFKEPQLSPRELAVSFVEQQH